MPRLSAAGELTEAGVHLNWTKGQASALFTSEITEGREVGNIRVIDSATGAPMVHEIVFAFAFHAFTPDGSWMLGS